MGGLLFLPALCGEVFWSAGILAALGQSSSDYSSFTSSTLIKQWWCSQKTFMDCSVSELSSNEHAVLRCKEWFSSLLLQGKGIMMKRNEISNVLLAQVSVWWKEKLCADRRNSCRDSGGPSGPRGHHIRPHRCPVHLDRGALCSRLHRRGPAWLHCRRPGTNRQHLGTLVPEYLGALVLSLAARSQFRPLGTNLFAHLSGRRSYQNEKNWSATWTRNQTIWPFLSRALNI